MNVMENVIAERIAAIDQAVARHIASSNERLRRSRIEKRAAAEARSVRIALSRSFAPETRRKYVQTLREDLLPLEDEGVQLRSIVDSIVEGLGDVYEDVPLGSQVLSMLEGIADNVLPCSGDNFYRPRRVRA